MLNLIDKYDYFFFDLWGVIYDGRKVYDNVTNILKYIKKKNKKIFIVSNTSKSKIEIKKLLFKKGIKNGLIDDIFTSGDYAKKYLCKINGKIIFINGKTKKNKNYLNKYNLHLVNKIDQANFAFAITINKNYSKKNIFKTLKECLKNNIKLICINPDLFNTDFEYGMGYFANYYISKGGKVDYFGKPSLKFFRFIQSKTKIKSKKKILFIGDTIYNDIVGANSFGINSLLIKESKINKKKIKNFNLIKRPPKKIFQPTYKLESLKFM